MASNAVEKFQRAFADWLGVPWAFAFWKGRVAEYAILRSMGISDGDEVILPGYTCVMDVNPIMYLGARPVYADIDPSSYNSPPDLVEQKITSRTKAIVVQHTYGYPCEMDGFIDLSKRHGIPLVEDCCHAMGSTYRGKLCGTFGVAAYWSCQWNKPITTGLGGLATVNDQALAVKIEALCNRELEAPSRKMAAMLSIQRLIYRLFIYPKTTAMATNLFRWLTRKGLVVGSSAKGEFTPALPAGFFAGMSAGQARAGLAKMKRIEANIAHRREITRLYHQMLREAGLDPLSVPEWMDPVLVRYPVRVGNKADVVAAAPSKSVEIGTWFDRPLHAAEGALEPYEYHTGLCPQAERACEEVVNLPTHPRAGARTARRSVVFLRAFAARTSAT